ncbi:MAG: NAD(P)-dependent oxidoreductase [Planctomycetota bacterium]|jgi:D-3-phosphoglycerate dehydrogenase
MKVIIFRTAPETIRQLIIGQFPRQWQVMVLGIDETKTELSDADAILPEGELVDAALLDRAKNLKLVQTGAGYDNVNIEECTKRKIYVAHAAGVNARAVAEHVFAFILCWYKNMALLDRAMKSGNHGFEYSGGELAGKIIGIVGLGNIGKEVARLAAAFDMKVLGYHRHPIDTGLDFESTDFESLLRMSDIVSVNVRLTPQTRHLIGYRQLEIMKNDAFFVNTARGAVVNETALVEALRTGMIGGAGLDVFENEPLPENSPLRRLNNVILTPHMASEPDALYFHAKRFKFSAENIERVSREEEPLNALNRILR